MQTLRRKAPDSGKCANGVQKVCSRFPTQKKSVKSYDFAFNIWCTSRDSNPGPTD